MSTELTGDDKVLDTYLQEHGVPAPINVDGTEPMLEAWVAKHDAMVNLTTGLGGRNDKSTDVGWSYEYPDRYILDAMHQTDTVVGRMCEVPPRDALAKGFEVKSSSPIPWRKDVDGDALEWWMREHKVLRRIRYALMLARLQGSSYIIMKIDDGRRPDEPVDYNNIRSVRLTKARERWEMYPRFFDSRYDVEDPDEPTSYYFAPYYHGSIADGNNPTTIHASRVLRFDGYELSRTAEAYNNWHGGSIVWRARRKIERFVGIEQAMGFLVSEAKEDVVYLENYRQIRTNKQGKAATEARWQDITTGRSITGTTVLDSKDRYETKERSLQGLADVYDRVMLSLAQAAEMPVTLLFGDAARGLSADDKAGRTYYAAALKGMQQDQIDPALYQLFRIAFASLDGPTLGAAPSGYAFMWPPYEDEDPVQAATRDKTIAEADTLNMAGGIYTAEDVRRSRYVAGAPGQIVLDEEDIEGDEFEQAAALEPGAMPDVAEPQSTAPDDFAKVALSGAQIASLMDLGKAVRLNELTSEQARAIINASFPNIDPRDAATIAGINSAGEPPAAAPPEPALDAWPMDDPASPMVDQESLLDAAEDEVTDFPEEGGTKKVSLRNSQHKLFDPAYAADLKENWPEIWRKGGNVEGNNQYRRLAPIAARGGTVEGDTEDMAVRKREAWGSRHKGNHRIAGVIALVKWLVVGSRGEAFMKRLIEMEKDKIRKRRRKSKEDGSKMDAVPWYREPATMLLRVNPDHIDLVEQLIESAQYLAHIGASRCYEEEGHLYSIDGDGASQIDEVRRDGDDLIVWTNRAVTEEDGFFELLKNFLLRKDAHVRLEDAPDGKDDTFVFERGDEPIIEDLLVSAGHVDGEGMSEEAGAYSVKLDFAPSDVMVALYPPAEWAEQLAAHDFVTEPAEDLHLTLFVSPGMTRDNTARLIEVLHDELGTTGYMDLKPNGIGVFNNNEFCHYLSLDDQGLAGMRTRLVVAAEEANLLRNQTYGFVPHMTLGYHEEYPAEQLKDSVDLDMPPFMVSEVVVRRGGKEVARIPMGHAMGGGEEVEPPFDEGIGAKMDELGGAVAEQVAEVEPRIEEANKALAKRLTELGEQMRADFDELVSDNTSPSDVAADIKELRSMYESEYAKVVDEEMARVAELAAGDAAARFGVDAEEMGKVAFDDAMKMLADSVSAEALNRQLGVMRDAQIQRSQGVDIELPILAASTIALIASKAITRSIARGRDQVVGEVKKGLKKDEVIMATRDATLDQNTCEECRKLDGETFEYGSPEYIAHLPPNMCLGGSRCRCVMVYEIRTTLEKQDEEQAPKMDPYTGVSDPNLPEKVKGMSKAAKERWVRAFNAAHAEDPTDEGRAFAIAYSAAEKEK